MRTGTKEGDKSGEIILRMNNELFRKKVRRKGTKKEEKEILKQLKVQMGKELTSNNLRIAQE